MRNQTIQNHFGSSVSVLISLDIIMARHLTQVDIVTPSHDLDIREPTWCDGSMLAQNARDVGSTPALDTIFPIFVLPTTLVAMTVIVYKLCAVSLLNVLCVWISTAIACMYVIVII